MIGDDMCGTFYVDDETMREIQKIARKIDRMNAKTGDVHPTDQVCVLRCPEKEIIAESLKWGYESFQKKQVIFNARTETIRERIMFRQDYETHRCVIPAGGFYEWQKTDSGQGEKFEFGIPGEVLFLAGIYHRDPGGDRFAVLTKAAEGCMSGIHDRMPLILDRGEIRKWLFSREEADRLLTKFCDRLQRQHSGQDRYEQITLFDL